jgi:hypothetical protein
VGLKRNAGQLLRPVDSTPESGLLLTYPRKSPLKRILIPLELAHALDVANETPREGRDMKMRCE